MNQTKRSLFHSLIALLLCFTTLLGTTFAWFTDVSFSKGNIIQTGNLKAEMYWADDYNAPTAEWTNAKDGPVFTYDNWEPGYTDVKYIKVKNEGNLSFKWQLTIEAENELTKLADVIEVYYVNPIYSSLTTLAGKTSAGNLTEVVEERKAASGKLLPSGTYEEGLITGETILAIALHMDENAGNEYQELSVGDLEVKLIATQTLSMKITASAFAKLSLRRDSSVMGIRSSRLRKALVLASSRRPISSIKSSGGR